MRQLLLSISILAIAGCAEVSFGPTPRTKSSLPAHVLERLPLLNIGDSHGKLYLEPAFEGRVRSTGGGNSDVGVNYFFHRTEDRLIGFELDFRDATFPACVKALAEQFGPPSEMTTRPLIKWGVAQTTLNRIVIWHTPQGDLTAVEYQDDVINPGNWPGEIKLETQELAELGVTPD